MTVTYYQAGCCERCGRPLNSGGNCYCPTFVPSTVAPVNLEMIRLQEENRVLKELFLKWPDHPIAYKTR